jgi:hypothetical protein
LIPLGGDEELSLNQRVRIILQQNVSLLAYPSRREFFMDRAELVWSTVAREAILEVVVWWEALSKGFRVILGSDVRESTCIASGEHN